MPAVGTAGGKSQPAERDQTIPPTRSLILLGIVIATLFFGAGALWAGLAPLNSAAIASGITSVDHKRKTVQHKEGGIVHTIHVHEGKSVKAGETLITLDDAEVRSSHAALKQEYLFLTAEYARLFAEASNRDTVKYPDWLTKLTGNPDAQSAMVTNKAAFDAGRADIRAKQDILQKKRTKLTTESDGHKQVIEAKETQQNLLRKELADMSVLAKKGLVKNTRIYALQRNISEIAGDITERVSAIAKNDKLWLEIEAAHHQAAAEKMAATQLQVNSVKSQLHILWSKLTAAADKLQRQQITSPINGVVVNLQIHSVGGVIAAGQPILDIVPENSRLVIEARLDPKDRDVVTAGQKSEVRFSAFSQKASHPVTGKVRSVSADSLVDTLTGKGYYLALIDLQEDPSASLDGAEIHPGMRAEVMIQTGTKTVLNYLLEPLLKSFNRALRES